VVHQCSLFVAIFPMTLPYNITYNLDSSFLQTCTANSLAISHMSIVSLLPSEDKLFIIYIFTMVHQCSPFVAVFPMTLPHHITHNLESPFLQKCSANFLAIVCMIWHDIWLQFEILKLEKFDEKKIRIPIEKCCIRVKYGFQIYIFCCIQNPAYVYGHLQHFVANLHNRLWCDMLHCCTRHKEG